MLGGDLGEHHVELLDLGNKLLEMLLLLSKMTSLVREHGPESESTASIVDGEAW